jgi:hypothetical protein
MRTPDLDEQLDRLENVCPTFLAKIVHFLREPKRRRLRLSVGGLLIIGGCFFFLPILCLEMIPIGLMLIAIDVPFLRRPVAHMIAWIERGVGFLITLWLALARGCRREPPHDIPQNLATDSLMEPPRTVRTEVTTDPTCLEQDLSVNSMQFNAAPRAS